MDSFVISGAPASISTRTETAITKPPVFHSETKRKTQLQKQNKNKTGKFLKGKRKNAFMKKENEIQEAKNKTLFEELKVTVPSVIPIQSSMQNDPSSSSLSDSSGSSEHSADDKDAHGRFSGASSPWYKMMISSNEEDDIIKGKKQVRKKKALPKLRIKEEGKTRNPVRSNFNNSVEEFTCPSSVSSSASSELNSSPQVVEPAGCMDSSEIATEIVKKRMQVKLGRSSTPETLIGTENALDVEGSDAKTNDCSELNEERCETAQSRKEMSRGRRSTQDSPSCYDYTTIYSRSKNMNANVNPEVALDSIQVDGMNQYGHDLESDSIPSSKEPDLEDENHLDMNDHFSNMEDNHNEDSLPCSSRGINVQNRLEEEIQHCIEEDKMLEEGNLDNEQRPFSQKSLNSESRQESQQSKRSNSERSLYRNANEVSKMEVQPGPFIDISISKNEKSDEKLPTPPNKNASLLLPTSRQSRPSSCSLPVSCCSSRMSDVEGNDGGTKYQNKKVVDDDIPSKELGSYGDILNVLERIEKETNEKGKDDSNSNLAEKYSSRSSSRKSSATYYSMTPRGNFNDILPKHPDEKLSFLSDGMLSDNISNDKHIRSSSKMSNLLSYLDNVEHDAKSGKITTAQNQSRENMRIAELALESSQNLAEQVVNLNYTVEEKERAVVVLKQALEHQRRLSASFSTRFQKELKQRLHTQKVEYEAAITRHQNFIDQLIDDKKGLSEGVDAKTAEMKATEKKHKDALKAAEQRHITEIKRLKALQESSNKLRQEKWVDEKTKRIKEQTVRGLEPEIQRLMARHTQEVADLEAERERQLSNKERELYQRHHQHIRELKDDWEQEHQEALQQERHALNQRHSQQQDDLTAQHAEEVERLHDQIRRERGRNTDERCHYEREAEQVRRIANERANAEIARIKEEEDNKRKVLIKKHQNELASFNETETADRNEWERIHQQKMEDEWKSREVVLKTKFKEERDEELDRAVERLEQEVTKGRKEVEQEYQERIRRLKEKYDTELEFSNDEITMHKNKFNKLRDEYSSKEEETIVLSAVVKTKEAQLSEMQKVNERLENERDDIRGVVRGEFSSALDGLTEERTALLSQLSDMRLKLAEAHSEQESSEKRWRCQAEEEAERIHSKIRSAIERKEETILDLKKKYERVSDHCNHLETLLQRQTKENYMKDVKSTKNTRL